LYNHRTVRRALLYRLHSWFGRDVFVHGATERDNGVFRCTLDGSGIARTLEFPAWMFDCAASMSDMCIEADPFVDLEALGALSALLDQVEDRRAIIECPASGRIWGLSRPESGRKPWRGRRRRQRSGSGANPVPDPNRWICLQAHAWWSRPIGPTLPEGSRETLLGLMTRLILDHARAAAALTRAEAGHDR
jgi:hypothetical protein